MTTDMCAVTHYVQAKLVTGFATTKSKNIGKLRIHSSCIEVINVLASGEFGEKLNIELFPSFQFSINAAAALSSITSKLLIQVVNRAGNSSLLFD